MATKHYDPKTFNSQRSIGYLLKMSHAQMHDCAEAVLAPHGVSFVQWIAMLKLREGHALTASDLCRAMRHDNGALTRIIDQLEERGYVVRKRSREDRRVVELELTAAGSRKLDELMPPLIAQLNEVLGVFSKAEFAELVRLLDKLLETLRAQSRAGEGTPS